MSVKRESTIYCIVFEKPLGKVNKVCMYVCMYTEMILHFRKFLVQRNLDGDWQNMFPITRFHYIGALFHIFYCYWGKENRLLYRGLHLIYRLRFIISRFLRRYLFALSLTNSPNSIPANSHALGVSLTPASWTLRSHAGSRLRANFSRLIEKCELLPSCLTQFPKIC